MRRGRKRATNPKTSPISVALSLSEKELLEKLCDELDISVSSFCRKIIIKELGE